MIRITTNILPILLHITNNMENYKTTDDCSKIMQWTMDVYDKKMRDKLENSE